MIILDNSYLLLQAEVTQLTKMGLYKNKVGEVLPQC